MLLVKTYAVLDAWCVEVSCIHGADPTQSHLVYREQVRQQEADAVELVTATSEVLVTAARLVHRGDLELTDDCPL